MCTFLLIKDHVMKVLQSPKDNMIIKVVIIQTLNKRSKNWVALWSPEFPPLILMPFVYTFHKHNFKLLSLVDTLGSWNSHSWEACNLLFPMLQQMSMVIQTFQITTPKKPSFAHFKTEKRIWYYDAFVIINDLVFTSLWRMAARILWSRYGFEQLNTTKCRQAIWIPLLLPITIHVPFLVSLMTT